MVLTNQATISSEDSQILVKAYIKESLKTYRTLDAFVQALGLQLSASHRSRVYLLRLPHPPMYDAKFITKCLCTKTGEIPVGEQLDREAAGMQHGRMALDGACGVTRVPRYWLCLHHLGVDSLASEYVRGKSFQQSNMSSWSHQRRVRFVRQVAAMRLAFLSRLESEIGVPGWQRAQDQGAPVIRVQPMCGELWWRGASGREAELWAEGNFRGPFESRRQHAIHSLKREFRAIHHIGQLEFEPRYNSTLQTYNETLRYLSNTIKRFSAEPEVVETVFSLNHGDLKEGYNLILRGSKVAAVIDWETSAFAPFATCVGDLVSPLDLNPADWETHGSLDLLVVPYDMEAEHLRLYERLQLYTSHGARRQPSPYWKLIEKYGGPLAHDDFREWASDEESDSDDDIWNKHSESDDEVDDPPPPRPSIQEIMRRFHEGEEDEMDDELEREGLMDDEHAHDWYYAPVWHLMKEYIMRAAEGKRPGPVELPSEYAKPLAEWPDTVYDTVTQQYFVGDPNQMIQTKKMRGLTG